ncbi:hypothetical protein WH50_05365 [Pokkaliibacter plantistimulans]|uniref:Type IV pilus assembly protein PilW n=1 Tax=Pokkaliibacter plantistimulans TaxID=1635171 RepID=A0ABX5M3P0_9GAMM|nr:PilW family protein [Pokkaliibacter plantistimulans]PXF32333.1 hypothetical protein WH50_05365 [Pokkaliibacter plantistimulans]
MNSALRSPTIHRQTGVSLIELMISLALGVVLVLAATDVLLSGRQTYASVTASSELQDTARYVQNILGQQIEHAGYTDQPLNALSSEFSADSSASPAWEAGQVINVSTNTSISGSPDELYLRLQGSSEDTLLDCLGYSLSSSETVTMRFFVDASRTLYCQTQGHSDAARNSTQPLVEGVENMHLLFGVDADQDRSIEQWLTPAELQIAPLLSPYVVGVRVGLVISSITAVSLSASAPDFTLLESTVSTSSSSRLRQGFESSYWLPNVALSTED